MASDVSVSEMFFPVPRNGIDWQSGVYGRLGLGAGQGEAVGDIETYSGVRCATWTALEARAAGALHIVGAGAVGSGQGLQSLGYGS